MKLERRKIWMVGWWKKEGRTSEFTVLSAFSTLGEAEEKKEWYEKTYTKRKEEYVIQTVDTWFPPEF